MLMEQGGYAELERSPREELSPFKLVEHLSTLAVHGPPALATSPGLQGMLSRAACLLPQVTNIVPGWNMNVAAATAWHAVSLSWDAIG